MYGYDLAGFLAFANAGPYVGWEPAKYWKTRLILLCRVQSQRFINTMWLIQSMSTACSGRGLSLTTKFNDFPLTPSRIRFIDKGAFRWQRTGQSNPANNSTFLLVLSYMLTATFALRIRWPYGWTDTFNVCSLTCVYMYVFIYFKLKVMRLRIRFPHG